MDFTESKNADLGGKTLFKAKIRGIYATALTKLLIENGFRIVDPSKPIQERFGLNENKGFPDLKIKDRFDRQGVRVIGNREAVDSFKQIIQLNLEDAITRRWLVSLDGIYKGLIKGERKGFLLVDLGNAVGKLPKNELSKLRENKSLLVQVERKRIGSRMPLLSTRLKIPGKYAILINTDKVGVSLKIRNIEKRLELYQLGKELAPAGWGIIWRKEAENQPHETLEKEIKELTDKIDEIIERFKTVEAPSLLFEGLYCMDIEFPALSKKKLDELRSEVAATLEGHHYYKACGGKVCSALEMAERLLEKGNPPEEIERLFKETIEGEYPIEGSPIKIEHVKLSGKTFNLGQGIIEEVKGSNIRFKRVFHKPGFYDGLKIRKEPGDMAITELKVGEWFLKTSYYSSNGEYKGTYINLNTPIEFYPYGIRYVDLEVDVCMFPDGGVEILDEEKLWRAVEEGFITERLANFVMKKARELADEFCPK
ncbi:ribonuclease E/G [Candidatus Bathyarchaeota archaeon]|nr:MAG: ribonuclease E/G [Candidatus Bathyarchaeota archaeon]